MSMTKVSFGEARKNFKQLTDKVADQHEQVMITQDEGRNVVLISEAEFRSWQETYHLLASDKNRHALDQSLDQLQTGRVKTWSFEDWQRQSSKKIND